MEYDLTHFEKKGEGYKNRRISAVNWNLEAYKQLNYDLTPVPELRKELESLKEASSLECCVEALREQLWGREVVGKKDLYETREVGGGGSGGGSMYETLREESIWVGEESVYGPDVRPRLMTLRELRQLIVLTGLPKAKELLKQTYRENVPEVQKEAEQMILDLIKEGKL